MQVRFWLVDGEKDKSLFDMQLDVLPIEGAYISMYDLVPRIREPGDNVRKVFQVLTVDWVITTCAGSFSLHKAEVQVRMKRVEGRKYNTFEVE